MTKTLHCPPALDGPRSVHLQGRRHHRLISALAFLALGKQSLSLMLPSHQCLSSASIKPHEIEHCHRRRRRTLSGLQLQFSTSKDDVHLMSPSCTLGSPSPHLMNPIQFMPFSYPSIHNKHLGVSSRMPTSLFMAESTGGFGKGDEKKKKRNNGDSARSKANKSNNKSNNAKSQSSASGVTKGTSTSESANTNANKRGNNKTKRTRHQQKNSKVKNKRQKNKGAQAKGKGKANATAKNHSSTLNTSNSSISTTDENTSLKGFKSEKQPTPAPKIEKKQEDGAKGSGDESNDDLQKRVVQLEMIVSNQMTEIQKLRREVEDLTKSASIFANVVNVLREAGLRIDEDDEVVIMDDDVEGEDGDVVGSESSAIMQQHPFQQQTIHDDMEIFGIAPKSVTDAADAAGASILSAILAGKHRMLVDVRDAELTRDPKLFVEFIELAILPVAAGLEGLDGDEYVRNRVKIVFPTVKELMSYRRSMALAAPEVVSLSTLGFDPVDERDNLIVVIAPSPDDMAGVIAMEKLIARTDQNYVEPDQRITQPVVVVNHHMMPIDMGGFGKFTSVYHLRLLSVQYMTGDATPEYVAKEKSRAKLKGAGGDSNADSKSVAEKDMPLEFQKHNSTGASNEAKAAPDRSDEEDEALEAAMTHAHEIGVHQGVTRAMVIRAYPKPWHVFVDTSPDTDADFEVAATFDIEPTQEDVNYAIVECLEGSEREDEIVAQQMQAALESGQLNRVSDMLGISPSEIVEDKAASVEKNDSSDDNDSPYREYDGNDWDDLYYDDWFSEDSV